MDKTAKYFRCEDKCLGFASSTDMIATPVTGIGFSEDGKTLFTAANDVLKSWNMYKNGVLLETFEAGWKGVQDISMIKGSLMGVAFSGGSLSLWCCDLQRKVRNNSQLEEGSFVLPKINKNPNRIGDDSQVREIQNLVGRAVENVNNIEDRPTRDIERKKE
jgi:WD40 repeat protein